MSSQLHQLKLELEGLSARLSHAIEETSDSKMQLIELLGILLDIRAAVLHLGLMKLNINETSFNTQAIVAYVRTLRQLSPNEMSKDSLSRVIRLSTDFLLFIDSMS